MPVLEGAALFATVMVPASFFLGFAVATAGFTCWNLVMPLLFNWLRFDLFDALFLSMLMDTVSSLVLMVVYLHHGKVDKPFVFYFGGTAATAAAVASRLTDSFLLAHKHILRGSVGYVPLFFGCVFLARATKEYRIRQRRRQGTLDVIATKPGSTATPERAESDSSDDGDRGPSPAVLAQSRLVLQDSTDSSITSLPRRIHGRSIIVYGPSSYAGLATMSRATRITITAILLGVLGAICGIVGSGGGVMYVSVIILLWNVDDLPLATGTGVGLMFLQCFALLADFVDKPSVFRGEMLRCCAIVLPCCAVGAYVASRTLLYMSRFAVNLTVSCVSFALGAVITATSLG
mmetsp:Transcript_17121/g.46340  ORF Transcript_17121/g.46340 Transcript_17121/m.46340 type:complete len:347 (+) Transcript_17121:58-1098(+)